MSPQPAYACAILETPHGELLLEQRPCGSGLAAGRLTCFGGRLEAGETALMALRRELAEELACGWRLRAGMVDLFDSRGWWIARFFKAGLLRSPVSTHAGHRLQSLSWSLVQHPRLSPWHRQVLIACRRGRRTCMVPAAPVR